ncbi:hypothetical protein Q7P37_001681 [Cladosporium fusiforme]
METARGGRGGGRSRLGDACWMYEGSRCCSDAGVRKIPRIPGQVSAATGGTSRVLEDGRATAEAGGDSAGSASQGAAAGLAAAAVGCTGWGDGRCGGSAGGGAVVVMLGGGRQATRLATSKRSREIEPSPKKGAASRYWESIIRCARGNASRLRVRHSGLLLLPAQRRCKIARYEHASLQTSAERIYFTPSTCIHCTSRDSTKIATLICAANPSPAFGPASQLRTLFCQTIICPAQLIAFSPSLASSPGLSRALLTDHGEATSNSAIADHFPNGPIDGLKGSGRIVSSLDLSPPALVKHALGEAISTPTVCTPHPGRRFAAVYCRGSYSEPP